MNRDDHLHNRMVSLANSLLERTRAGSIAWTVTDNERRFLFSGTNTSVGITSYVDRDGDTITSLDLLNSRGTVVETLRSEFEPNDDAPPYTARNWNKLLDDLYYAARRNALNVDAMLDDLLADLNDEDGTRRAAKAQRAVEDPWATRPSTAETQRPADDPWATDADSDEPPF
jgi:hypothetical protein